MHKTTVFITFQLEGIHNWPAAKDIFPDVGFLSDRHRHMFHFKLEKVVNHNDRDIEFIRFKREVISYLTSKYGFPTCLFTNKSCEMIAQELLEQFECDLVEVSEDGENGAKIIQI